MKDTIICCEESPVGGEDVKYCATSLEDLVDYVISKIGSQFKVLFTTIDKDVTIEYTIEKAHKVSSDGNCVPQGEISICCVSLSHDKKYGCLRCFSDLMRMDRKARQLQCVTDVDLWFIFKSHIGGLFLWGEVESYLSTPPPPICIIPKFVISSPISIRAGF